MNETLKRSISGFFYVLLLIAAVSYSKESNFILFCGFLACTVYEFCKMNKMKPLLPLLLAIFSYLTFAIFFQVLHKLNFIILFLCLLNLLYLIYWIFSKKEKKLSKIILSQCVKSYLVFSFLLMYALCFESHNNDIQYSPKILLTVFILIWVNDTFAYITGKTFGKNKLFSSISPKKTIEGFVGGLIFSVLVSIILAYSYLNKSIIFCVSIAMIVSFFGTIGDLVESKFKRQANIKDSGNIMPGHGGIFDRLDSVIFAIPFVFLFIKIFNYVS